MEVIVPNKKDARFLNIKEAATVTGLSQFFLRQGCKSGAVPHIMSGRTYMINMPMLYKKLDAVCNQADKWSR